MCQFDSRINMADPTENQRSRSAQNGENPGPSRSSGKGTNFHNFDFDSHAGGWSLCSP